MRREAFVGEGCWQRDTPIEKGSRIQIPAGCLKELDEISRRMKKRGTDAPDSCDMPACEAFSAIVRRQLDEGIGFAVLEPFPLDDGDHRHVVALYWTFLSVFKRPVAQNWAGKMVWDVRDTGLVPEPGNGIRASQSHQGQAYHTDNCCGLPPEYVSLLCLNPAMEGGLSGLVSFEAAYNRLLHTRPRWLERLFRPFYFDRQRDHGPMDEPYAYHPVFEEDRGRFVVRFDVEQVRYGYELAGRSMDDEARDAIHGLASMMESGGLDKTFGFQRGQIQILNNRRIGHRRTAYVDWPEPERRRHLIRLWLRDEGWPTYSGTESGHSVQGDATA